MSSANQSYDDALLEKLQCIAWSPWRVEVECLDVFTKVGGCLHEESGFLAQFLAKLSALFGAGTDLTRHPRLLRQASMLKPDMARNDSAWGEDRAKLRLGLNALKDPRPQIKPRELPNFTKNLLPPVHFVCKGTKGLQFVLSGIGNVDLQQVKDLTCTLDDVMLASVPYEDIVSWTDGNEGSWFPNTERRGLLWSRKEGSINSIWIVTGVFYAKALTVKGPDGVFAEIKVDAAVVVPGVPAPGLKVHVVQANELEIKAPPRKHFIVGYRAIRLDYNPDGSPRETVGFENVGAGDFRGDDTDLASQCLKSMETDLFEVDEDGAKASIPWLAPSEAELVELVDAVESQRINQL